MCPLEGWQTYAVPQRRLGTGCIPTGYEMILRAAKTPGIDFAAFQDDFDLDKNLHPGQRPQNNFESVAEQVGKRYPAAHFRIERFDRAQGLAKVRFLENQLRAGRPALASICSGERDGRRNYHIYLVIDETPASFILLSHVGMDGITHTLEMKKSEIAAIHEHYPGGNDVAYLD